MKRYLIAGLLVWVPLGITIWVLHFLVTTLDQTLLLFPEVAHPDRLLGFHLPGLGVLLSFGLLLLTGVVAANFFGARLIHFWENALGRIPVVKSIYSSVKQVSDTLLSDSGNAFRKALLVEFPHEGSWTIAFLTGHAGARRCDAPHRRARERLRADHPESDVGLFHHRAARARARTRHDRRRSAEIRHIDGRRVPACARPAVAQACASLDAAASRRANPPPPIHEIDGAPTCIAARLGRAMRAGCPRLH